MRFGDTNIFNTTQKSWEKLVTQGQQPTPRGHHTGTYVDSLHKLIIFGGYGGSGVLFPEMSVLDIDTNTWGPMPTQGI